MEDFFTTETRRHRENHSVSSCLCGEFLRLHGEKKDCTDKISRFQDHP